MDLFKNWMLSLGVATIISSLCKILLSDSSVKKTVGIFFSVFILFYTITPIKNIEVKYDIDEQITSTTDQNDIVYKKSYEKIMINSIKDLCGENDVEVISYEIDSYIDEENVYCVSSFKLTIDDKKKTELIKNLIKNQLGYEVTVY